MLFCLYILKDRRSRIKSAIKSVKDEQQDLSIEKGRLNGFIYDIKLAIKEYHYRTNSYQLSEFDDVTSKSLLDIKNANTGLELKEVVENLFSLLERIDMDGMDLYAQYRSYKTINSNIITNISSFIINNNRNFTVFQSRCLSGDLLNSLKYIKEQAELYGLEESNYAAEKAKETFTRVIKGTLRGSRISNDVFDMVVTIPDIYTDLKDNMFCAAISKKEKNDIIANLKYLRNDGVMFVALPFYRMHKDICALLAKQLKNVIIVKGINEDADLGLVYIIGQKRSDKILDENIYEELRKCYNYNNVKELIDIDIPNYVLPRTYSNIDLFKGSVIDQDEILNIAKNSGCLNSFFKKQKVKKITDNVIEPLLPFNIGQIGLVLTSGCLDGIIDEGDGHFHLVKGMVSKKTETERTVSNGTVEQVETISNKVEINVLLPDGKFKTLT